jgi:hypothetical protein
MNRWLTFLKRRWLINIIHHAMHSPEYDRAQYLCIAIKATHSKFTYRWACKHIKKIIGGQGTLWGHFIQVIEDDWTNEQPDAVIIKLAYAFGGWKTRKEFHMKYWLKVQEELEAGSWDKVIKPDLTEIHERALRLGITK